MSYESVKLAAVPTLYWRLDRVGSATNGDEITDLSGNDLHGTLVHSGSSPVPPYGHSSPIESDPASRAFFCNNDPSVSHASITLSSSGAISPAGNLTLEGWFKPTGIAVDLVGKRNLLGDSYCFVLGIDSGGRFTGRLRDSANTEWLVTAPSMGGGQSELVDIWWYVVLVRLGNALSLYVNGTLRATTTITSGLPTLTEAGEFRVHAGISGVFGFYADEVALSTFALSGTQILTQYQAAFNTIVAHGECHIRTTTVLAAVTDPDPIAYPFRHNWSSPVVERLSWRSSVYKPTNGATQLGRQRLAPRRTIEYNHLLMNEQLRRRYEAWAFGGRKSVVQFEPDKVELGVVSAGATSATFNTTLKDYEVGHRAYIWQDDDTYELVTLTVVGDGGVEWSEPLEGTYTNAYIKPARNARCQPETQIEQHTDTVGESSTIYAYDEADEPLIPRRLAPYISTLTYRDRDLWDLRSWQGHNYVEPPEWEWVADRTELDNGTGQVSTKTYRWGAETLQPWNMLLNGRTTIAKYLGWLYERRGQYSPFWMPTFKQDLRPLGRQGTQLMVEGHEYSNLYAAADNRIDLAFVYNDNTYTCAQIVDLVVGDGVDLLYLDISVPTFTNLRWLSFLRRVILSSDDLELAWETDNKMQVAFAVVDAPLDWEAGSPSVSPSPSPSGSPTLSPSPSASASGSPSGSASPSPSVSLSVSPSASQSPSASLSPSSSTSPSVSPSGSTSPSASTSPST